MLVSFLQKIGNPRWLTLSKDMLDSPDSDMQRLACGILKKPVGQSNETLMIAVEALQKILDDASKRRLEALTPDAAQRSHRLLDIIVAYSHPEARRMINRSERSPYTELHKALSSFRGRSARTSIHSDKLEKAIDFRSENKLEEALNLYNEILRLDPLFMLGYGARASILMRLNRPEEAAHDLKVALELNPEDATTESLAALAQIRLSQVTTGLQQLEDIAKSIPDLPTLNRVNALYNCACGYGRALEVETDPELQARYRRRGIAQLRLSVFREEGFNEEAHLLNDPDLNSFHDHPEWEEIRAKVRQNEAEAR